MNGARILITSSPEFQEQYQVRFKYSALNKEEYTSQIFQINKIGEVTGLKKAFIYDHNFKTKIIFEVNLIKNVWQGLFKGYISDETIPTLFAIFKDQIKEGEEIEID